jgi:hypothetical protein
VEQSLVGSSPATPTKLAHGAMVAQLTHNEKVVGSFPAGPTHGMYSVAEARLLVKQLASVRT